MTTSEQVILKLTSNDLYWLGRAILKPELTSNERLWLERQAKIDADAAELRKSRETGPESLVEWRYDYESGTYGFFWKK